MGMGLNTTSNDEHVGDIEKYIRRVTERSRSIYNTLPFHQLPTRLIIKMAYTRVLAELFPQQKWHIGIPKPTCNHHWDVN
jgi:hypothetical protein